MQKVFKLNKNNKIEFTKEELKILLDEVYQEGYQEGKSQDWYWNSPWPWNSPYLTTITSQASRDYHLDTSNTSNNID